MFKKKDKLLIRENMFSSSLRTIRGSVGSMAFKRNL